MDKSKAQKAVKKAKSRKSTAPTGADQIAPPMANMAGINPEIQTSAADLQPADGFVNPYRYTGAMAPTEYAAGNMLPGLQAPQMIGR